MSDNSAMNLTDELEQFRQRYRQLNGQIVKQRVPLKWTSKYTVVLEHGSMQLIKFAGGNVGQKPLLISYSHVNRPGIIDLHQDHSLIQCLIKCGHPVYLLDWGNVRDPDKENNLSVYVDQYIDIAVNHLVNDSHHQRVNILGICQGGTFSLCYASLHPDKINRLVTMVTPVDFHCRDSLISHWVDHIDFTTLEQYPTNVSGAMLTMMFQMMRPFEDLLRQVNLIEQPSCPEKLDFVIKMDQWIYDCPDQPGRAFAQFMIRFFQQNALVQGRLEIGGKAIDLSTLSMPILNVYAANDHLVPPASSTALAKFAGKCDYHEKRFEGGHIGLLVSRDAQQTVLPEIGQWLSDRK